MVTPKCKRPICPVCKRPAKGPLPNKRGGFFWACVEPECPIVWDLDGERYNDPAVVAPASSRHGRVISIKAKLIARGKACGLSHDEATEFVHTFGVSEFQKLLTG